MILSKQLGLGALIAVNVKGMQKLKGLGTSFNKVRTDARRMGQTIKSEMARVNRSFTDMRAGIMKGMGMIAVGGAIAAPSIIMGKVAADFEDQMGSIKSLLVTSLPEDEVDAAMRGIQRTILDTGKRVRVPLGDLADSYYQLQSAIGSVVDTQAALEPTAALAIAGKGTMADAVGTMTKLLNTYGKAWGDSMSPVEKATKIANIAASTIAAYNTELPPLSSALRRVAGSAKTAGVPLAELFTIIGAAQTGGLEGELAGTGLDAFFRQVSQIVSKRKAGMTLLPGIALADDAGKILPFYDILGQLEQRFGITAERMKELADQGIEGEDALRAMGLETESSAELFAAFGDEGAKVIKVLLGQSEALRAQTKATEESDNLTKMLDARQQGLIARLTMTANRVRGVAIAIGEKLLPAQKKAGETDWVDSLNAFIESTEKFVTEHPDLIKAITAITLGIAALTVTLGIAKIAMAIWSTATVVASAAWGALNAVFVASPLGWIVLAIAAVGFGIYMLIKHFDAVKSAVSSAFNCIHEKLQSVPDLLLLFALPPLLIIKHWDKVKRIMMHAFEWIEGAVAAASPYITALQTILNVMWDSLKAQIEEWWYLGEVIVEAISGAWNAIKDNPIISLLGKVVDLHVDLVNKVVGGLTTDFVGIALDAIGGAAAAIAPPANPMAMVMEGGMNAQSVAASFMSPGIQDNRNISVTINPPPGIDEHRLTKMVVREIEKMEIKSPSGDF